MRKATNYRCFVMIRSEAISQIEINNMADGRLGPLLHSNSENTSKNDDNVASKTSAQTHEEQTKCLMEEHTRNTSFSSQNLQLHPRGKYKTFQNV